jgi:hypothetical protein
MLHEEVLFGHAVNSPAFAAAVFDLYVGDQPVSSDARTTALLAAQRMTMLGARTAVLSALFRSAAGEYALHGHVAVQRLSLDECAGGASAWLSTSCWLQGLTGMRRRRGSPAFARALAAAAAAAAVTPASGGGPERSPGTLLPALQQHSGMTMYTAHRISDM